eukprot:COSAG01_NODE_37850_length_498_cov_0.644110_1_plen_55_part_10
MELWWLWRYSITTPPSVRVIVPISDGGRPSGWKEQLISRPQANSDNAKLAALVSS